MQILNKHLEGKDYKNVDIKEVLNKIKNTIEKNRKKEKKNSNAQAQFEIEEEDKTSCNDCITCLKQCWPHNEIEK